MTGYYLGRLIDHIHLRVSDLEASKVFYRAVLASVGMGEALREGDRCFYADELYVDQADDAVSRIHIAFQAPDRDAVVKFHEAALQAGGTDNGAPGWRCYHSNYFAAYVLDPDGNNIEVVCDAPTKRSAESIRVERIRED